VIFLSTPEKAIPSSIRFLKATICRNCHNSIVTTAETTCGASMTAEFHGITGSDSRSVKLLEGSNQCLEEGMLGDRALG